MRAPENSLSKVPILLTSLHFVHWNTDIWGSSGRNGASKGDWEQVIRDVEKQGKSDTEYKDF